jgi:hypothetical protein
MAEKIADVVFVMGLRADPQGQALHGQQILRLRHHGSQVVQFEEDSELAALAEKPFTPSLSQSGSRPAATATRTAASRT